MLLEQFKQIQGIDKKINELHKERLKLFDDSSINDSQSIVATPNSVTAVGTSVNSEERWMAEVYAELLTKWQSRGIKIQSYKKLKTDLERARETLLQVYNIKPELHNRMSVVLVPPTKELKFSSVKDKANARGQLHLSSEFVDAKFRTSKPVKSWRTMIVFSEPEGLYIGTPERILNEKRYVIADYDTYALGVNEYAAMVLQESAKFDEYTWTALLKDCAQQSTEIPSVKYDGESYVFAAETSISAFGDIRFRPAIEI